MKVVDGYYQVEVRCSKETADEMLVWLEGLGHELDRIESALGEEPTSLRQLIEKVKEHGGTAGFIFEMHFPDEDSAMLAKMKYGK